MPIYEYECKECNHVFEVIQRASDPEVEACGVCGGEVRRRVSPPAIHFKGSGWYVSDYGFKSKAEPGTDDRKKSGGGDKASSESKDSKATGGTSSKD